MTLRVRPAVPDDLPAIAEAKMAAGLAAWPHILPTSTLGRLAMPDRWLEIVHHPGPRSTFLVAELDGSVVGFAVLRPSGDGDAAPTTGELDGFYTAPAAWGRGAGRALMRAGLERLRDFGFSDATLWTAAENHRPRRIYEQAGWHPDGTVRHRTFDDVEFAEVRYRIGVG